MNPVTPYPELTGQRALDRAYDETRCTIIAAWDSSAVVEYDDEPDVPVSVGVDPVEGEPRFKLLGQTRTGIFDADGYYKLSRKNG